MNEQTSNAQANETTGAGGIGETKPFDPNELKGGELTTSEPLGMGGSTPDNPDDGQIGGEQDAGGNPTPAPAPVRRVTNEEIINDCALTVTEKNHLTSLFEVYKQMHDLCFVKRTFGECARRGFTCDDCALGKNLQVVRKAFGIEFETVPYDVEVQKICDEHIKNFERELETSERHYTSNKVEGNNPCGCPCETRSCGRKVKGDDAPPSCTAAPAEPTADAEQFAQKGAA